MKIALTTLALLLGTTLAQAQTLNTWNPVGDVLANGGTIKLSTAYDGADAPGTLSGNGAVDIGTLETAAGVAPYGLDLSETVFGMEGSLIQQNFNVLAGQTLSFDWSFSTLDDQFTDRAFIAVNGQVSTLTLGPGASSGHFSNTFAGAGSVSLAIGVADMLDYGGTSTLTLSNIALTAAPVPEPASAALLLGGLGLVAWRRRAVKR